MVTIVDYGNYGNLQFEFERKKRQQWRTLFKESARDLGEEEEVMIRYSLPDLFINLYLCSLFLFFLIM